MTIFILSLIIFIQSIMGFFFGLSMHEKNPDENNDFIAFVLIFSFFSFLFSLAYVGYSIIQALIHYY